MSLIDLFMFNEQYTFSLTCKLRWLVYGKRCFMNTNEYTINFLYIKVNKQLVKLGKYFTDFNFRGSRLTAKYRENWMTRKFPILRYIFCDCVGIK